MSYYNRNRRYYDPLETEEDRLERRLATQERREQAERNAALTWNGAMLELRASFDQDRIEAMRQVPGRRYDRDLGADVMPAYSLAAVEAVCEKYSIPVRLTDADREQVACVAAELLSRPQLEIVDGAATFIYDYNPTINDALRGEGGKYDYRLGRWTMSNHRPLKPIAVALRLGSRISPDQAQAASEEVDRRLAQKGGTEYLMRLGRDNVIALAEVAPALGVFAMALW